ncbi:KAP family NTPase [Vibrio sp. CCB-PB317]|uniref:P-loop NTPase fold protein n=1 Tax=Vibrio sp. CCB-PB317 TaxID=2929171 RepID=UPI001FAC1127|nr:P-loop NTPase fold protein [Vibrio sp. CCB-PB317]MCJ0884309.1 KAP family NTPase [Vibrio sp. CCB-PB317]
MSIVNTRKKIENFLLSDTPEVLVIKGDWGVGKTFTWKKFFQEIKEEKNVPLEHYSYVSLFGIESLHELKRCIALNKEDTKAPSKKTNNEALNFRYYKKKIKNAVKPRIIKMLDSGKDVEIFGVAGLGGMVDSILYATLNNTIVCFDDLERHSDSLSLRDILGMASHLKEEGSCKIVILLNENGDKERLSEYFQYYEKVVDCQLSFNPTANECFDLAISKQKKYELIRKCCINLEIKNIRVLKKIERHVQELLKHLSSYDEAIVNEVISSVIAISWCYYCHSSDKHHIPSFEFITKKDRVFGLYGGMEDNGNKQWSQKLNQYGYKYTGELDLLVADCIIQGYVDEKKLKLLCTLKQDEISNQSKNRKLEEAWELFHDSFEDNTEAVISSMRQALDELVCDISSSQYGQGVALIRKLGGEQTANQLIAHYIDSHKNEYQRFNLSDDSFNPFGVHDEVFSKKLKEAFEQHRKDAEPIDILERRRGGNSYDSSEAEVLGKVPKEKLKEMVKSFRGKDLEDYVRVLIMMGGSNQKLQDNINKILQEIGNENKINEARLAKFGIRNN